MIKQLSCKKIAACMALTAILILTTLAVSFTLLPKVEAQAKEKPLFSFTMMATNYNPVRRQWTEIIVNSWQNAGIDARVVFLPLPQFIERLNAKVWAEGGYDIHSLARESWFDQSAFWYPGEAFWRDKGGFNKNFWEANVPGGKENKELLDEFLNARDEAGRRNAFAKWQKFMAEWRPDLNIWYGTQIQVTSPEIQNLYEPLWQMFPAPQYIKGTKVLTLAATGSIPAIAVTPLYSNAIFDIPFLWSITEQLVTLSPAFTYVPQLATSWDSRDGKTWTIKLREGVKWQDGVDFTADDVVFSIFAQNDPDIGALRLGAWKKVLGTGATFTYLDGKTISSLGTKTGGSVKAVGRHTIEIVLPAAFGIFFPEMLSNANGIIVPKHVVEQLSFKDLRRHSFATGTGDYTYKLPDGTTKTWTGPVGTGPYIFKVRDTTKKLVTLTKNPNYWNRTALERDGLFTVETYNLIQIIDKEAAIAALKNKEVNVLDFGYNLQLEYKAGVLSPSWAKPIVFSAPLLSNGLPVNMKHPILGTGVDTPLGKRDPSKAAEAAKHVRAALSYLMPRQIIVDNLAAGMGVPYSGFLTPLHPYFVELPADEFSVDLALKELREAGYEVGKPSKVTEIESFIPATKPIPSTGTASLPAGEPITVPSFILGMSTHLAGTSVNPATGLPYSDRVVIAQESVDKKTWTNIAVGSTDVKGRYDMVVTPTRTGPVYYRLFFPAISMSQWGPATVDMGATSEELLKKYGIVAAPVFSEPIEIAVATVSDAFAWAGKLAQVKQLEQVSSDIGKLSTQIGGVSTSASSDIARLSSQIGTVRSSADSLKAEIQDVKGQISSMTIGVYAALAVAIILGAVGTGLAFRAGKRA